MTASRGDLVPVSSRVEGSCELDTFQGFLPHDHGLQLYFAHNNSTCVHEELYASCILGFSGVELYPCTVAKGGLVARDVDIVLDANSSAVERA